MTNAKRKFNLGSGKSVAEKMAEIKSEDKEVTETDAPKRMAPKQEKKPETIKAPFPVNISVDKIELDATTKEALQYKYNLVEEIVVSSFKWKRSHKKQLQHLSIETGIEMEAYLSKWVLEGLEKELKKIGEKIKK